MTAGGRRRGWFMALTGLAVLMTAGPAWAQSTGAAPPINSGDTAWVLASSALVLAMIVPGLALFYGGLVRSKNVLGTIMQSFMILCLVSPLWVLLGYTLAFGPDHLGLIGGFEWAGLGGVGPGASPAHGPTIPREAFMVFQLMFAAITPAFITGTFAERMRFSALLLFAALWSLLVYAPLAHWVWGGGWLQRLGALDFAGGAVVHTSAGVAALVCAVVLGQRQGYGKEYMAPHNLPLTLVGAGLLWFGWFGLNAGSAMGANAVAARALLATHSAAAAGALSWLVAEWLDRGAPAVLGLASGAVAGLVAITPGAGYVSLPSAILIGLAAGPLCYLAVTMKTRFGYDDALDVVGIHGVGGIIGLLATGLMASKAYNPSGADGLLFGNPILLGIQALTVLAVAATSLAGTWAILKLVDRLIGLRVSEDEELLGLDLSQHRERAYTS